MITRQKWAETDFEEATCFRCGLKGDFLYQRGQFGIVVCNKCNQVFVSPRLNENARAKIYQNADYFNQQIYGFSNKFNLAMAYQKIWIYGRLNLIIKLLKGNIKEKQLLDIGSAYGLFLASARKIGFEITGIEYSATAVKWARENLSLNVHCGTIETTNLPKNFYDVVCFWDVIEHIENPLTFLRLVRELTKDKGLIVFSCPYFDSLAQRLLKSKWNSRPEQHLWQFTTDKLKQIFSDANLKLLKIIKNPFRLVNLTRIDSIVAIGQK